MAVDQENIGRRILTAPKADLLQGTLDLLILKALSLGLLHWYGVIQCIRQLSGEMLNVEQESLYPALYRIEQRGSRQLQVGDERDRPPGEGLYLDQGGAQTIDCRSGTCTYRSFQVASTDTCVLPGIDRILPGIDRVLPGTDREDRDIARCSPGVDFNSPACPRALDRNVYLAVINSRTTFSRSFPTTVRGSGANNLRRLCGDLRSQSGPRARFYGAGSFYERTSGHDQ